jgi:hypothetical protein
MSSVLPTPTSLYIIPGWIYAAMMRNRFNIIDAAEYARLRNVLSVQSLAEVFYINSSDRSNPLAWLSSGSGAVDLPQTYQNVRALTPAETTEIHSTIYPMSKSTEIVQSVCSRLASDPSDMIPPGYRIIHTNTSLIYVIVEAGFSTACESPEYLLQVVKDLLIACYRTDTLARTSYSTIFNKYLQLLKAGI